MDDSFVYVHISVNVSVTIWSLEMSHFEFLVDENMFMDMIQILEMLKIQRIFYQNFYKYYFDEKGLCVNYLFVICRTWLLGLSN